MSLASDPTSLLAQLLLPAGREQLDASRIALELGESDPRLKLLADYFAARRAEEEDDGAEDEEVTDDEAWVDAGIEAERLAAEDRLRGRFESMAAELSQLRELSHELAGALGACERCWGADTTCRSCRGDGGPGAFLPEMGAFEVFVLPAVRRLRRHGSGASAAAVDDTTVSHQRRDR